MPNQIAKVVAIEVHATRNAATHAAAAMRLPPRGLQSVEVLEVQKLATLFDARSLPGEPQTFAHPSSSTWLVIGRR